MSPEGGCNHLHHILERDNGGRHEEPNRKGEMQRYPDLLNLYDHAFYMKNINRKL